MGGDTTIQEPTPPEMPSIGEQTSDAVAAQVAALPQIYQSQLQYQPKFAQLDFDMYQKYQPQYTQVTEDTYKQIYPELAQLRDDLTQQASEYMQGGLPDYARKEYLSNLNSELGYNAASPVAADYKSRGLMQQGEDWRRYGQNFANTLVNRMPITQAYNYQAPQQQVTMPTGNALIDAGTSQYGTYSNAYTNQYGMNQEQANQASPVWGLASSILGGAAGGMFGMGGKFGQSIK